MTDDPRPVKVILVSGSRHETSYERTRAMLYDGVRVITESAKFAGVDVRVQLRHGGCPTGVDEIAGRIWAEWVTALGHFLLPADVCAPEGSDPERFRRRNQWMVDKDPKPAVCVALADRWASGTGMCARMARSAGVPTFDFGVDTRHESRPASRA
jgi:hypothetical protein